MNSQRQLAWTAAMTVGVLGLFAFTSAQGTARPPSTSPSSEPLLAVGGRALSNFASGDVIYGPAVHQNATTSIQNVVINHPLEPATFGAMTVYNASATNGVTIRQVVDGIAHHIDPGQTLAFPVRLELGRQVGVQFDAAGSDNQVYWVIRNFQVRPTDL